MQSCFGPSKATRLKNENAHIRQSLGDLEEQFAQLQKRELRHEKERQQQAESLQAAAARIAWLEQQRAAEQERRDREVRNFDEIKQQLTEQKQLTERLQQQLLEEQRRSAEQLRLAEEQAQQLKSQLRLYDRQLSQAQQHLKAEEKRARSLQSQVVNFNMTMDEVAKVLFSVEQEPAMPGRKPRPSVADQLRQSIARYNACKHTKEDEGAGDQDRI